MELLDIRTSTITSKGQIVIPGEIRLKKGFRSGEKVAIVAFDDHVEIRPLKAMLANVDFEAERRRIGKVLRDFVDKNGLRGKKIRELTNAERDQIAKDYLDKNR